MLTRVCLIKYVGLKLHLPRDTSPDAAAAAAVQGFSACGSASPAVHMPGGALAGGQGTWGQSKFTFNDLASGLKSQHYYYRRLPLLTRVLIGDVKL